MAYDYLGLSNEVLSRMNEVVLTTSNFGSARGFQIQCKNAVNDAVNYINQREYGWPFNHSTHTETLVAGTTRYSLPANTKHVDYETFRIVKDATLGSSGGTIRVLDYKEYVDKYIEQEDDTTIEGGIPVNVFRTPSNDYGLYPYPDKAYDIRFDYYSVPSVLANATDVPTVPEQFRQVVADGATAYAYQYRGEAQQYGINFARFEEGIKHMQSLLLNRTDYVRSTYIPHSQRYGINVAGF